MAGTGGKVTFTPALNFFGTATCNYTVNDNDGATSNVATITVMALLWRLASLPPLYLGGVAFVAALLAYEQSLVSPDDLSQVKKAFDLNGYVGIVYFAATALAIYLG